MTDTVTLRSLNKAARHFLGTVVKDLSDEQIRYSAPAIDKRSIAGVAVHAYCSILGFRNFMDGKEFPKPPEEPTTTADLLALLDSTHDQLDQMLADLPESILEKKYKMPWGMELTGLEALTGVFGHTIIHAGNIQGIRAIGGFPTPAEG